MLFLTVGSVDQLAKEPITCALRLLMNCQSPQRRFENLQHLFKQSLTFVASGRAKIMVNCTVHDAQIFTDQRLSLA